VPGSLSPGVQQTVVRFGAWMPFGVAADMIAYALKVSVSDGTVRRQSEAAGAAYVAVQTAAVERLERESPVAPTGAELLLLSADGAMVPLVGGEWAEVKSMAIGVVTRPVGAEGEPEIRTSALSYFSRLSDHETFARQALVETHRRGVETAQRVVAVADGSEWLQSFADYHRPDAVRILDFPHCAEHLSAAAQAVWGAGSQAVTDWLATQTKDLLTGSPETVLAAVRALPTDSATQPSQAAEARDKTLGYLEKRQEQIRYADFLAQGYPIGSGAMESANKLVVEARLKGSGMHWQREKVNPMLALRNIACNDRWEEAWPQITAELRRQAQTRTQQRHALRPIASTPDPAKAATSPPLVSAEPPDAAQSDAPPLDTEQPVPPTPRPKKVVNGKPTADHCWRQFRFGRASRQPHDRSAAA